MIHDLDGVIFSDLDGTFLDARYRPILDRAAFANVSQRWRVVWVTSRTAEELIELQSALGHIDDAIGENGGVVLTRDAALARALGNATPLGNAWVARLGDARDATLASVRLAFYVAGAPLHEVRTADAGAEHAANVFVGGDRRRASVLLSTTSIPDQPTARALTMLRVAGFTVNAGGHWTNVLRGSDKGRAVRAWMRATFGSTPLPSLAAIGNTESDATLLEVAEQRFVIRHTDGTYDPWLAHVPHATLLARRDTAGWTEMLEVLRTTQTEPAA